MSWPLRVSRWGLLLLVALMPLHAFLSVWAGHVFGHQAAWQSWKELTTLVIGCATVWLLLTHPETRRRLKTPLMYAIAAFTLIGIIVSVAQWDGVSTFIKGAKIDYEFLVLLVVAYLVSDTGFIQRIIKTFLLSNGLVILFGLLQIFLLPQDVLVHFGYGANTIQPYLLVSGQEHMVRILSTLGGPNQLAAFLIVPLCLVVGLMVHRWRWWQPIYLGAGLIVELHTYGRAAWLGLIFALIVTLAFGLPRKYVVPALVSGTAILILGGIVLAGLAQNNPNLQFYLLHGQTNNVNVMDSTDLHREALRHGLEQAADNPLGQGLGFAGPASFNTGHQFIPENYYLQIAIETGIAGLSAFLIAGIILVVRLWGIRKVVPIAPALIGSLAGVAVVNMFLHGLADSTLAMTLGILCGATVGGTALTTHTVKA